MNILRAGISKKKFKGFLGPGPAFLEASRFILEILKSRRFGWERLFFSSKIIFELPFFFFGFLVFIKILFSYFLYNGPAIFLSKRFFNSPKKSNGPANFALKRSQGSSSKSRTWTLCSRARLVYNYRKIPPISPTLEIHPSSPKFTHYPRNSPPYPRNSLNTPEIHQCKKIKNKKEI